MGDVCIDHFEGGPPPSKLRRQMPLKLDPDHCLGLICFLGACLAQETATKPCLAPEPPQKAKHSSTPETPNRSTNSETQFGLAVINPNPPHFLLFSDDSRNRPPPARSLPATFPPQEEAQEVSPKETASPGAGGVLVGAFGLGDAGGPGFGPTMGWVWSIHQICFPGIFPTRNADLFSRHFSQQEMEPEKKKVVRRWMHSPDCVLPKKKKINWGMEKLFHGGLKGWGRG